MPATKTAKKIEMPVSQTVIEFPDAECTDKDVKEILADGNFPLLVGKRVLAEIASKELNEGLKATGKLKDTELDKISAELAANLTEALDQMGEAFDPADIAADAAALFILSLRANDMLDVKNLPPCSISFSPEDNKTELVLAG